MLLDCFNCPKCSRPYERSELLHAPWANHLVLTCALCRDQDYWTYPLKQLDPFLEQPNIKKTKDGWVALGPLEPGFKCTECKNNVGYAPSIFDQEIYCSLCNPYRGGDDDDQRIRLIVTYYHYAKKVASAVHSIEESLKTELPLDPTCTRCRKSMGTVKNKLVVSCSSVLCPECYYTMDMRNDCHICGESLYLHLEPGRKLLEAAEAKKAKEAAVSDVESEEYGEIINANDCQDVVNFVNVTSKKLQRCQDPSLAELWKWEKLSMNDECGTLSASSTGKTRIRTWRNVNEPFSSDEAYEYDDGNDE